MQDCIGPESVPLVLSQASLNAGLSVRNAKIPPRIRQPLQTERIVLKMPVTFASEAKRKQKNETSATIKDGVDAPVLKPGVNLLMTKITNLI